MNLSKKTQNIDSRVRGFDSERDYYIFEYAYDPIENDYSHIEGEVVDIVKGTNSMDALEKAGIEDFNRYSAKPLEDFDSFKNTIKEEKKLLSKLTKKIDALIDVRETERKKFFEERPCPNGCGKMDEQFRCSKCGYGHETEQLIEQINKTIEDEKAKGNDTTELESIRDAIKKDLKL